MGLSAETLVPKKSVDIFSAAALQDGIDGRNRRAESSGAHCRSNRACEENTYKADPESMAHATQTLNSCENQALSRLSRHVVPGHTPAWHEQHLIGSGAKSVRAQAIKRSGTKYDIFSAVFIADGSHPYGGPLFRRRAAVQEPMY